MSAEPTPGADRYAEYRRGHVPAEQRDVLVRALATDRVKLWLVALLLLPGAAVGWASVSDLQSDENVVGRHEFDIMYLAVIVVAAVAAPFLVTRHLRRRADALRELTANTVAQSEGTLAWRKGSYGAFLAGRRLWCVAGDLKELVPGPYRLFFLPKSHLLVAAERAGAPIPRYDVLLKLASANRFKVSALATNRAGRRLGSDARFSFFPMAVLVASVLSWVVAPAFIAWAISDLPPDMTHANLLSTLLSEVLGLLAGVVLVGLAVLWSLSPNDRPGRVASTTGRVDRASIIHRGKSVFILEVNGLLFSVSEDGYDALDERLIYRVYYTPRTKRLLNMESVSEAADMRQGAP